MLIDVILPLSLAIIMLSLGIGLTFADFGLVLKMPKAVGLGLIMQIFGLPALAFLLLQIFPLPPALAFGVMLLSFCPGGVTSSMLTKLARGAVAVSITMTAVASLISVISIPLLVSWAATVFLTDAAAQVDVTSIAISMFMITALPVFIGVMIRHFVSGLAIKIEPVLSIIAAVLFVVIMIAALATNWGIFIANVTTLAPLLIIFNIIALTIGVLFARGMSLDRAAAKSIAIELGVQNGTLGVTVSALLYGASVSGLGEYAVPSAVYGLVMYAVTIPFIFIVRSRFN